MSAPDSDVTLLLKAISDGDASAESRLMAILYEDLRRLAQARMRSERPDHTLTPTALVNEAYLRLAGGPTRWENRAHFFSAAAEAMRRVLIDHARKHSSLKRGGEVQRVTFTDLAVESEEPHVDLLALNDALTALSEFDARLGEVVKLRYFAGLSIEQTAEVLGISPATVKRDWTYARAWLYDRMSD